MKNFYQRLEIPEDATSSEIRKHLASTEKAKLRNEVEYILLEPNHRRVYDRTYRILKDIGQLRANLGLLQAPNWQEAQCSDFNASPQNQSTSSASSSSVKQSRESGGRMFSPSVASELRWLTGLFVGGMLLLTVLTLANSDGRTESRNYSTSTNSYSSSSESPSGDQERTDNNGSTPLLAQRRYPSIPLKVDRAVEVAEKLLKTERDRSEILSKDEFDELHGVSGWHEEELKRYAADTTNYPEGRLSKLSWIHGGLEFIDEELRSEVPSTGTYWTYTQERTIAPLEVITRGRSNYYIKLVC